MHWASVIGAADISHSLWIQAAVFIVGLARAYRYQLTMI
jgi:hypothetical protein